MVTPLCPACAKPDGPREILRSKDPKRGPALRCNICGQLWPICPTCHSTRVAFVDEDILRCDECAMRDDGDVKAEFCRPDYMVEAGIEGRRKGSMVEYKPAIESRPDGADFDWYLRDVIRVANNIGYQHPPLFGVYSDPTVREWKETLKIFIDVDRLQKDWGDFLGDRVAIDRVASAKHCHDELIRMAPGPKEKAIFAQALSQALHQLLREEKVRYVKQAQSEMEQQVYNAECHVATKLAAEFLSVSPRQILNLVQDGVLSRCRDNIRGKIDKRSLIQEYERRKKLKKRLK